MARLARRPWSGRQVTVVMLILALCLALLWVEHAFGWPEWLTVNRIGRKP